QIGSYDFCTRPFCQYRKYQANWPLAYDQQSFPGLDVERLNTLHTGIDRLDKRRLLVRDMVRQFDNSIAYDPIHDSDILGKTSAAGIEAGGSANLLVHRTLSKDLVAAVITLPAWD